MYFFRYDFTGTMIVIPDISVLSLPGVKADLKAKRRKTAEDGDGITGLKSLGTRELTYKTAFLACSVTPTSFRV